MSQQVMKHQSFRDVAIRDHGGGGKLMPQTFGDVVAFSEIMARAQHAIPKHLRDVPGACLAVTMQAMRWEMDPFAVASKSYNVKDLIAYEAQLIAAVVHTRAPIKTRPEYAYTGEGQDRRCTVSAMFDDGVTRSYESPRIADITVKNSPLWKADPDQQLGYFSIRSFARRYCPEVILGVYTPEEAEQFRGPDNARDVTPTLADRLATAKPSADAQGFTHQHVINEIDGNTASPPAPVQTPAAPAVEEPAPAPPNVVSGSDALETPAGAGEIQESSAAPSPVPADDGGGGIGSDKPPGAVSAAFTPLPQGWEQGLIAALKRARKVESLKEYAKQYFDKLEAVPTDPRDKAAAKAIRAVFEEHFGNPEAIADQLREIV